MEAIRQQVLDLLSRDGRCSVAQMAVQLGVSEVEVETTMKSLEQEGVILGYTALVNWDAVAEDSVTAMIEVSITPQRDLGFDDFAKRIYQFPQVTDCYLVSGGFDLMIIMQGKSLLSVARFVSDKIAPMDSVLSTRTHFILKKYKVDGHELCHRLDSDREAIVL